MNRRPTDQRADSIAKAGEVLLAARVLELYNMRMSQHIRVQ